MPKHPNIVKLKIRVHRNPDIAEQIMFVDADIKLHLIENADPKKVTKNFIREMRDSAEESGTKITLQRNKKKNKTTKS